MRVQVDEDRCIGTGQCVFAAPDVFDQDDEYGVVVLLDENPPRELHADVRDAAHACPGRAIAVDEQA